METGNKNATDARVRENWALWVKHAAIAVDQANKHVNNAAAQAARRIAHGVMAN